MSGKTKKKKTARKKAIPKILKEAGKLHSGGVCPSTTAMYAEAIAGSSVEAAKDPTVSPFLGKLGELTAPEDIIEAGRRLGVIQRQRKVDLPALVRATITAMSPVPGTETTAFVNYLALTGVPLAPSAFYNRFNDPFAKLMRELAIRALEMVREVAPNERNVKEYGILLEKFADVTLADSTCKTIKVLAKGWAPSTSKKRPAAVKFHTVISLRDNLPIAGELTDQRMHDNKAFPEEVLQPGTLAMFDLGYIDIGRFIDIIEKKAFFLTRLKSTHDPEIVRVYAGSGSRIGARRKRLSEALEAGVLDSDRKGVIDLDVRLHSKGRTEIARVVAVEDGEGERHWYITNVDRETLSPQDVSDAYRLRWEVALFFKQLKSGAGFNAILAWRPCAVLALVYAKVISVCLARQLELSVEAKSDGHVTGQLALLLTLSRAAPLLLSFFMQEQGVTLTQLEERIIMIAGIVARSRNQRRDREKRKRQQALGRNSS